MYLVGTKLGTRYSNSAALVVTANTDVFTTDYAPTYDDSFLYVYVISNTSGVFNIMRTNGTTTITETMNCGNALHANVGYTFIVPIKSGDTINVQYSVGATINTLILKEFV